MINLAAGIVHSRLKYWRFPLPLGNNVEENSRIWKSVYNTSAGKGTTKKYIDMVSSLT
jgi:hypothetical protein|tara:strand:+ start:1647 stop:1820 length:174 start_codon:yes stop_codon:yes gene_type:complete